MAIDNLKGGTKRGIGENTIDNLRGGTKRVYEENTINNLRGGTKRVILVGGGGGNIDELNVIPSTSAQTITASGGVDGYSPVNVSAVDASIDANITAGNIKNGVEILGVTGSVVELNGETKTVTPQVYGQTLYPTSPKNAITEITVNAVTSSIDANITAGNIKKDVTILGVTGSYEGAGGLPGLYREFQLDNTGKLIPNKTTTHIMNFTGMTDVDVYMLYRAYQNNTAISGAVDMSDLTTLSGNNACGYMFNGCTGITSADLSSLTTVNGSNACQAMFAGCTGLTSVVLSALTTISGNNACQNMFAECTGLTSIVLSALTTISGTTGLGAAFNGCTSLATVYIGGTTAIDFGTRTNQFQNMFSGCTQNIDVYAPAANQAKIESFSGYPNFGGTGTVTWHWRS